MRSRVAVAEAPLRTVGQRRAVEARAQVAGVQQREPDACVGGGGDQCLAHVVRVGVGPSAGTVVQVVEFADRGDSRQRHLGVHRAGKLEVALRRQSSGDAIHQLAPRPERAAAALRVGPQCAVKRV